MMPFKFLISRVEALKIISSRITPIERVELVSIEDSANRILSTNVTANIDVPPFNRSAMDGYALNAKDSYGASSLNAKTLKVVGVLHAGDFFNGSINLGECVRIATGCPIPSGVDSVVMVEYTEEKNDVVKIFQAVYPGANISPKGEDVEKGKVVLKKGMFLTPAKVGVLAALGVKKVEVYQKPKVAVIPTGNEVCEVGSDLKKGKVYDVNTYTLSTLLSNNGASVTRSSVISDSVEELTDVIKRFSNYDIIIFSGGSSVGERDLMFKVIKNMGEIFFHGVQIKPGKPTLFGEVNDTLVFGMPGYPTSCLSNAYLFLIPAIRKTSRLPPKKFNTVSAKMAKRIVSSSGREQFLSVKVKDGKAYSVFKKSGDITSLSEADGYVVLPINLDVIEENEEVTVTLFN